MKPEVKKARKLEPADRARVQRHLRLMEQDRPSRRECPSCGSLHCWIGTTAVYADYHSGNDPDWRLRHTPLVRELAFSPADVFGTGIEPRTGWTPEHLLASPAEHGWQREVAGVLALEHGMAPSSPPPAARELVVLVLARRAYTWLREPELFLIPEPSASMPIAYHKKQSLDFSLDFRNLKATLRE